VNGNDVSLNWMTASEINNQGFEVERQVGSRQSAVGNWERIGYVEGKGTTTDINHYSFSDKGLTPGTYQYRIKQMDFDGSFEYYNLSETVEIGLPTEFVLEQNYPNPFNPSTKIRFVIPNEVRNLKDFSSQDPRNDNTLVTLRVFDILGNEVATLVNEEKPAGSYTISFDASQLSSGVYFYKFQSGGSILTKKMLMIK
jgi:hypothetical protein